MMFTVVNGVRKPITDFAIKLNGEVKHLSAVYRGSVPIWPNVPATCQPEGTSYLNVDPQIVKVGGQFAKASSISNNRVFYTIVGGNDTLFYDRQLDAWGSDDIANVHDTTCIYPTCEPIWYAQQIWPDCAIPYSVNDGNAFVSYDLTDNVETFIYQGGLTFTRRVDCPGYWHNGNTILEDVTCDPLTGPCDYPDGEHPTHVTLYGRVYFFGGYLETPDRRYWFADNLLTLTYVGATKSWFNGGASYPFTEAELANLDCNCDYEAGPVVTVTDGVADVTSVTFQGHDYEVDGIQNEYVSYHCVDEEINPTNIYFRRGTVWWYSTYLFTSAICGVEDATEPPPEGCTPTWDPNTYTADPQKVCYDGANREFYQENSGSLYYGYMPQIRFTDGVWYDEMNVDITADVTCGSCPPPPGVCAISATIIDQYTCTDVDPTLVRVNSVLYAFDSYMYGSFYFRSAAGHTIVYDSNAFTWTDNSTYADITDDVICGGGGWEPCIPTYIDNTPSPTAVCYTDENNIAHNYPFSYEMYGNLYYGNIFFETSTGRWSDNMNSVTLSVACGACTPPEGVCIPEGTNCSYYGCDSVDPALVCYADETYAFSSFQYGTFYYENATAQQIRFQPETYQWFNAQDVDISLSVTCGACEGYTPCVASVTDNVISPNQICFYDAQNQQYNTLLASYVDGDDIWYGGMTVKYNTVSGVWSYYYYGYVPCTLRVTCDHCPLPEDTCVPSAADTPHTVYYNEKTYTYYDNYMGEYFRYDDGNGSIIAWSPNNYYWFDDYGSTKLDLITNGTVMCSPPELILTPKTASFVSAGEGKTFSLVATRSWTAGTTGAGFSVSPTSGEAGTTELTVTADENEWSARTGTLTVTSTNSTKTASLSQNSVSPDCVPSAAGDPSTISRLNVNYYYQSGSGSRWYYYNNSYVSYDTVTGLWYDQPTGGGNVLTGVACGAALTVSPTMITFPTAGDTKSASITIPDGHVARISATGSGFSVDPSSVTGSNSFNITADENTGNANRNAVIRIEDVWGNYCFVYCVQQGLAGDCIPSAADSPHVICRNNVNYYYQSGSGSRWYYYNGTYVSFDRVTGLWYDQPTGGGNVLTGVACGECITTSPTMITFPTAGATKSSTVTAPTGHVTSIVATGSGFSVDPESVTSGGAFDIIADENTDNANRTATITISDIWGNTCVVKCVQQGLAGDCVPAAADSPHVISRNSIDYYYQSGSGSRWYYYNGTYVSFDRITGLWYDQPTGGGNVLTGVACGAAPTVSPSMITFPQAGSTIDFSVTAPDGHVITPNVSGSGFSISPSSITGSGTFSITASADSGANRTGTVTISDIWGNAATVYLVQKGTTGDCVPLAANSPTQICHAATTYNYSGASGSRWYYYNGYYRSFDRITGLWYDQPSSGGNVVSNVTEGAC